MTHVIRVHQHGGPEVLSWEPQELARPELLASATALFERIQDGTIRVADPSRYPLREAARAHTDLESRRTSGSVLLIP